MVTWPKFHESHTSAEVYGRYCNAARLQSCGRYAVQVWRKEKYEPHKGQTPSFNRLGSMINHMLMSEHQPGPTFHRHTHAPKVE